MEQKPTITVQAGPYEIAVQGDPAPFQMTCRTGSPGDGIATVELELTAAEAHQPPELTLAWDHALIETHQQWHPAARYDRTLKPGWFRPHMTSKATSTFRATAQTTVKRSINGIKTAVLLIILPPM